jgi:phosphoesterase RecJ-like protein
MATEPAGAAADSTRAALLEYLRAAPRLTILVHRNPDGDCVGSALALAYGLRCSGAEVHVVSPDPLNGPLLAIPGAAEVQTGAGWDDGSLPVCIDVSDPQLLEPLPAARDGYLASRPSANIDHHLSNLRYAACNYVDVEAAAVAEIVFTLLADLSVPLTPAVATQLLYGIVNDTHSFQNANTTARTLRTAGALVEAGAPLDGVVYRLLLERTASSARLWAQVLPTLLLDQGGTLAILVVSSEALRAAGATLQDADGLVDFLRTIQGVSLAVLLKQIGPDRFRLSLRSDDSVDSTIVAGAFGGGGHRRAAGCDASGSAEEIIRRVTTGFRAAQQLA